MKDVLTVNELAEYLRMKPLTIYKHLSLSKLPGFKMGSCWRFRREAVEAWIAEREIVPTP